MKLRESHARVNRPTKHGEPFLSVFLVLLLLVCVGLPEAGMAQQGSTAAAVADSPLSAEQVVQNLIQMNAERGQALRAYQGTRLYRLEYRGFPSTRSAEMVVNVKYLSPRTKEFVVQSTTGSKLIVDKVFKKLLEAESEALGVEMQQRTALNSSNYKFALIGYESGPSGANYVLTVEPRTKDKYLYRGRIWVDAQDFAVVRLQAEPAKNPSFWIKNTEVEQVYKKVNDFWLPARNRSVSNIRLGGHAELTIEYKEYEITEAGLVTPRSNPHTDTARGQR